MSATPTGAEPSDELVDPPATGTLAAPTGLTTTSRPQGITLAWDDPSDSSITG